MTLAELQAEIERQNPGQPWGDANDIIHGMTVAGFRKVIALAYRKGEAEAANNDMTLNQLEMLFGMKGTRR